MVRALPLLLLTGCIRILVTEDAVTFDEPVTRVIVVVHEGDVELVGADVDGVRVERHVEHTAQGEPRLSAEVVDGVLTLTADCPDTIALCSVDHRVVLPPDVSAEIVLEAGSVAVTNIRGALDATTGSGDVAATDVSGAVRVETGSGDVTITGDTGPIEASSGSGDIRGVDLTAGDLFVDTGSGDLDLRLVGQVLRVVAATGSGDVDLRVPAGAYALDVATGSGDVSTDGVTDDPQGPPLAVESGSGDVTIVGE